MTGFHVHLKKQYPNLVMDPALISENLISPHSVELPMEALQQGQKVVKTLFTMAHQSQFREFYQSTLSSLKLQNPGNFGIMMSYDFHWDSDQQLRLIEVNTNAAFLILGYELYRWRNQLPLVTGFALENLKSVIENEFQLKTGHSQIKRICIVDDAPEKQKLFSEFLVAQQLFQYWGWKTEIIPTKDYRPLDGDFVYNRDTDFYFQHPQSQSLQAANTNKKICVSPQPFEYFLLADKERMIDWGQKELLQKLNLSAEQLQILEKHIPQCFSLDSRPAEEIWSQRKKLFFKPKRAFGAKNSYRGESISRKLFDSLPKNELLAQEFIPAPEVEKKTSTGSQKFKYDLRFYAYKDQVQMVLARLYQGQVTNLKTTEGGFAIVNFKAEN